MFATKLTRKTVDPSNAKEYYNSYLNMLRNIITLIWIENPNIFDIKSVTIEHPKTLHELFETIRQAEKVSQVGSGKSSILFIYTS